MGLSDSYLGGVQVGLQQGARISEGVQKGLAEYRRLQKERQQRAEYEEAVSEYEQAAKNVYGEARPGDMEARAIQEALQSAGANLELRQRPTTTLDPETGMPQTETVLAMPQGEVPIGMVKNVGMQYRRNETERRKADIDALMSITARYPDNPLVQQFANNRYQGIQAKINLEVQRSNAIERDMRIRNLQDERRRAQLAEAIGLTGEQARQLQLSGAELQKIAQLDPEARNQAIMQRRSELATRGAERGMELSRQYEEGGFVPPPGLPQRPKQETQEPPKLADILKLRELSVSVPTARGPTELRARSAKSANTLRDELPTRQSIIRDLTILRDFREDTGLIRGQIVPSEELTRARAAAKRVFLRVGVKAAESALQESEIEVIKQFMPDDPGEISTGFFGDRTQALIEAALETVQAETDNLLQSHLDQPSYAVVTTIADNAQQQGRTVQALVEERRRRDAIAGQTADVADPSTLVQRSRESGEIERQQKQALTEESESRKEITDRLKFLQDRMIQAKQAAGSDKPVSPLAGAVPIDYEEAIGQDLQEYNRLRERYEQETGQAWSVPAELRG